MKLISQSSMGPKSIKNYKGKEINTEVVGKYVPFVQS